jgi:hypothetical protein
MSKKSRKRNKKILGALAAGLGAMALMKGRGAKGNVSKTAAMEDANINTNAPILGTDHITKKVVAPIKTYKDYNSRGINAKMLQRGAMNKVPPSMRGGEQHAEGYQRYVAPNRQWPGGYIGRKGGGIAKRGTGVALKHGGSVTGAATRGFGRALMKGKK